MKSSGIIAIVLLTILALSAVCDGMPAKKKKNGDEKPEKPPTADCVLALSVPFDSQKAQHEAQDAATAADILVLIKNHQQSASSYTAVYEPGPSSRPLNEDSALYDGAIPGQQAPQMPYYQHQQAPQMPYYQQQHAHPAPPSPLNSYMSSLFHAPSGTPPHRPASPPEPWPYQSAAPAPSNGLSYLFDARTPQHGPASPQASSPYSHNNQSASPQSSTNSNLWRGQ
ncbi:hypothetical protein GPALN_005916 [Globodera pallida]|nr:hypothetical protein GPALN_005916 [Globodera pallida]